MKNMLFAFIAMVMISITTQAQWASTPAPRPNYPGPGYQPGFPGGYPNGVPYYGSCPYPYPAPQPLPFPMPYGYITCFTQGLGNGFYFYGIGANVVAAQQWAMYACNSTGQYCQLLGCRY